MPNLASAAARIHILDEFARHGRPGQKTSRAIFKGEQFCCQGRVRLVVVCQHIAPRCRDEIGGAFREARCYLRVPRHHGGDMANDQVSGLDKLQVDVNGLYREETYTDMKVATIRRLAAG